MIVLMSDFGMGDGYVAAMKGVIASVAPNEQIIDASHDVAPQDVADGAWVLANYISYYPEGTIHVAVVDPGVGTNRSIVLVEANGQRVIAPDNGLLSVWLGAVESPKVWRFKPGWHRPGGKSATFHGRDIMSYAAGLLATGSLGDDAIEESSDPLTYLPESAVDIKDNQISGQVMHIDRFGNAISGITATHLRGMKGSPKKILLPYGDKLPLKRTYADVTAGKSLALINSSEHLEVAVRAGNASVTHGLARGSEITVQF